MPGSDTGGSAAPLITRSSPRLQQCPADRLAPLWAPKLLGRPSSMGDSRRSSSTWWKSCPESHVQAIQGLNDLFGFPTDFLLSHDAKCCANAELLHLKAQGSQPVILSNCRSPQPSAPHPVHVPPSKGVSCRSVWVSWGVCVLAAIPVLLHRQTGIHV